MNRIKAVLKGCALVCATFLVTAFGSRVVASRLMAPPPPPTLPRVESFDFGSGMRRFTGALSPRAHRDAAEGAAGSRVLAVVLRKADLATCEDLGRQLRTLRRAYGPARPVLVWTDDVDAVRRFMRREHLGRFTVRPLQPREVMGDGRDLATPAALLATTDGRVLEGVSHVRRAPNARLQSFAEELTLLRPADGR